MAVVAVRQGLTSDAEAIAGCLSAAFEPFRSKYTPGAFADTVPDAEGIRQRMVRMTIYVAVADEAEIAGTVALAVDGDEGHLRGMAVQPFWQGHGIAETLLRTAEEHLTAAGCRRITLDTTGPLRRAIRFYEKNGFVPSSRVEDFFGMPLHQYVKELRVSERS